MWALEGGFLIKMMADFDPLLSWGEGVTWAVSELEVDNGGPRSGVLIPLNFSKQGMDILWDPRADLSSGRPSAQQEPFRSI